MVRALAVALVDEASEFPPELQAVTKISANARAKTVRSDLSSFIIISFIDYRYEPNWLKSKTFKNSCARLVCGFVKNS